MKMTGQERRKLFADNLEIWKRVAKDEDMSHISSMYGYYLGPIPVVGFNMLSVKTSSDLDNFLSALALIEANRRHAQTRKASKKQRKNPIHRRSRYGNGKK